jgi:guanylate kinase
MKPELKNKVEFQRVLADYKINERGHELLAKVRLVLLVSPTSAGRNTIIRKVCESGQYRFIVSDTTRPKRQNNGVWEQDGVEYWFRTEEEVLADLESGLYLEAELIHDQQVSGISLRELEVAAKDDKIAIDEVDYLGVANVIEAKPDTCAVLVLPPSPEEWMRRLTSRGDMTSEEIRRRLVTAEKILESAQTRDYYKIIINDDLEEAVVRLRTIVEQNEYSDEDREHALAVAWKLLGWVKQQLHS